MKSRIVKIGNSRGLRIPKPLLEQTGLGDEVEIEIEENRLVISPIQPARAGWDAAFEEMSRRGADSLLDGDVQPPSKWDEDEWEWE